MTLEVAPLIPLRVEAKTRVRCSWQKRWAWEAWYASLVTHTPFEPQVVSINLLKCVAQITRHRPQTFRNRRIDDGFQIPLLFGECTFWLPRWK